MSPLRNGQTFPHLEIAAVGGGTIRLPDDLAGSYGVVLIYRGAWCPFCNEQLAAFEGAAEKFVAEGIKTVAFSVDDEAMTAALVAKHHLRFPVGHSADADKVAVATGALVNNQPHYLHSTGFVLAPNGSILVAVYSSGAIGRLVVDDVIRLVRFAKSRAAQKSADAA